MPKGIPNKRYTPELKQMAVEAVVKEGLSYNEAARIYGIDDHDCIQRWERICLTEGPEGLALEQRGRGSTGSPNTKAGIFTGIAAGYRSTAPCSLLLSSETDEENR